MRDEPARLLDRQLDRLYELPLDRFTSARNELAAALRKAGERDESERVKALQKPTQAAWAVNQLARRQPEALAELLEAGERLRQAQADALVGRAGAAAVREAAAEERDVVQRLTQAARELLSADRKPPTQALLERVSATLRAAAVDEAARPLLAAGRLVGEVEATGFGALAGMAPSAARRPPPAGPPRGDPAARRREAQQRARELRAELREREREARALEREAEQAEETAAKARAAADEAAAAARDAEGRLRTAEDELARS